MVKFNKDDYNKWNKFRNSKLDSITKSEYKIVSQLHAKYYKHQLHYPCPCSPTVIKRFIKELNLVWDNGNK